MDMVLLLTIINLSHINASLIYRLGNVRFQIIYFTKINHTDFKKFLNKILIIFKIIS